MNITFEGRRVLLTGAAGGLGKILVENFYKNGTVVYALDLNMASLKELKDAFPKIIPLCVDLSNWEATKKAVESCGPLDHLVNNAVFVNIEHILEGSKSNIEKMFSVNVTAAVNTSQVFAKNVTKNGIKDGTIVNVSSVATSVIMPCFAMYIVNKAALEAWTKCLAVELGPQGVRVNAIAPTGMDTPLFLSNPPEITDTVGAIIGRQPIPGLAETQDAANLILYLSSSNAKMITGQIIPVDGGLSIA